MLHQKEVLNWTMQQRLMDLRESFTPTDRSLSSSSVANDAASEEESHGSHRERVPMANERRNRLRAEHTKAVISDLCEIVADLFVAESKLLDPSHYGVQASIQRSHVLRSIEEFVSALPPRYALGVNTPSEVLLHMRLMAAVRSDQSRAVVHIVNLEGDSALRQRPNRFLRQVTISCCDANGILEYITKLLATGGSRVLDADVMTTTDGTGIILVRLHLR
jgi:(p)ppGpp synthase/HD superfamily hydrolase